MSEEQPHTPRSRPKAQKKPRAPLAPSGPETIEICKRMARGGPSSIHRSPPRGPKRP